MTSTKNKSLIETKQEPQEKKSKRCTVWVVPEEKSGEKFPKKSNGGAAIGKFTTANVNNRIHNAR